MYRAKPFLCASSWRALSKFFLKFFEIFGVIFKKLTDSCLILFGKIKANNEQKFDKFCAKKGEKMKKNLQRDSVIIYRSVYNIIRKLSSTEKIKVYEAIISYGLDGKTQRLAGLPKSIFELAKPLIDANNKKYLNRKGKKAESAADAQDDETPTDDKNKRGTKQEQTGTNAEQNGNKREQKQNKTVSNVNVNDNVNGNVNENVNENVNDRTSVSARTRALSRSTAEIAKQSGAVPPTVEEVANYCSAHSLRVNAERFCNYYQSKGWRVGNVPMSDWQATLRNWDLSEKTPDGVARERSEQIATQDQRCVLRNGAERRRYTDDELQSLYTPLDDE